MRVVLNLFAACLITIGLIWVLQDYNILPGSLMDGQIRQKYRGEIAVLAGVALLGVGQILPKNY
jgi:hypothetical protein